MKMELRDNGSLVVSGYVNVTDRKSKKLRSAQGAFVETIQPGTFARSLQKAGDKVEALFNHQQSHKLGSIAEGNLQLQEDNIGLRAFLEITDEEAVKAAQDGKLTGWSFGFSDAQSTWKNEDGMQHRTISELTLHEVSLLTIEPAYLATSVEARSSEVFIEFRSSNTDGTDDAEKKEDPAEENVESSQEEKQEAEEDSKEESGSKKSENSDNLKNDDASEKDDNKKEEARNMEILNVRSTEKEERSQFDAYLRGEQRALQGTGNVGSVIPTNIQQEIVRKITEDSPIFAMARKFDSVNGTLKIARESAFTDAGFVGENVDVADNALALTDISLTQKRVGAALSLSKQMINDSAVDLVSYATDLLARRVAKAVEKSMLMGQGGLEFVGIKGEAEITNEVNVPVAGIPQGGAGADLFLDAQLAVNPAYLTGSAYILSRPLFQQLAKLRDEFGHYYLQNGVINGKITFTFAGLPVYISDVLEAGTTAGDMCGVFGNFGQSYGVLVKKGFDVQNITLDTTQALRGSQLLVLDGFMDGAVYNPEALVKIIAE